MSPSAARDSGSSAWPSMQPPPADQTCDYLDESCVRSVPAVMNYVSHKTLEVSTRRDTGGSDSTLVGAIWEPTVVRVANARLGVNGVSDKKLTLERNGFELYSNCQERSPHEVTNMDFLDQDQVVNQYYPICEHLVHDALQSYNKDDSPSIAGVFAFDHNVRSKAKNFGSIKTASNKSDIAPQIQNPASLVHADYTHVSAPKRLNDLCKAPKVNDVLRPKLLAQNKNSLLNPDMVREALEGKRRYAFINVWRSIDTEYPVKDCPLACVDASTASMKDMRTFKIHYVDRVGENYFVCPSSNARRKHDWYYYPDMSIDEVLLLKQWDSFGGVANDCHSDCGSTSTFTIHSAFINSACLSDGVRPRKSIEVRCVVLWDKH